MRPCSLLSRCDISSDTPVQPKGGGFTKGRPAIFRTYLVFLSRPRFPSFEESLGPFSRAALQHSPKGCCRARCRRRCISAPFAHAAGLRDDCRAPPTTQRAVRHVFILAAHRQAPCSRPLIERELRGSKGIGVVSNDWFEGVLLSFLYTCSNPRVDRCSNPLPWDSLRSPYRLEPVSIVSAKSVPLTAGQSHPAVWSGLRGGIFLFMRDFSL